jgi:hypothetical protein
MRYWMRLQKMIARITWVWSAKANEAITSPVPVLFMPSPKTKETVSFRSAWKTCASKYPEAKALIQSRVTMTNMIIRKFISGWKTALGNVKEAFE